MYNILTLNKIAQCGLSQLGDNYTITDDASVNADGIILRSFNMHDMELGDNLKAVARAGAGTNNIPIDKCTQKGVAVFNTPGANANAVKELVIAALFLASRDVVGAIKWAGTLSGDDVAKQVEKGKSNFAGCEIKGKTLGVIGLGAIGILVANAALKLGMNVVGYDPYLSVEAALKLSSHATRVATLDEVYAASDYITIHVPLMDSTKNTICKESLAKCKDGVKILNFARAGLVNADDIKEAIATGKVSTYVVDFPDENTINQDGIIAVPHLGASTEESEDNCAVMAAKEIKAYLETGNVKNAVNLPNCSLPVSGEGRVAIIHKNVPNVIAKFTDAMSSVNISDMISKSKGEVAYTIMNTDHEVTAQIEEKLNTIDEVISVRVF
ncbi:MAG: 3-phosphoglycerate dehydrogenase [Clostridia bacterium]|nr:3-phosphoglycerate dehydrogenase [Clostridia bacterium]